jgi:lycopene cyclase domain-containing protein
MFKLTYPEFHAVFVVPALIALAAVTMLGWYGRRSSREDSPSVVRPFAVAVITLIALVYTIPWDNYLIYRGVWWYGDGRVTVVLWNAPLSEYVFILLVPLIGALWLHLLSLVVTAPSTAVTVSRRQRITGAVAGAVVGVVGLLMTTGDQTLYVGSILAWSGPVLALQWAVGWPYLWARRRLVVAGILVPTLYLSAIDRIAIASGAWQLSPDLTTGITLGGLPVEEGLFFLVTSVFIIQGLVLYPWVLARWR